MYSNSFKLFVTVYLAESIHWTQIDISGTIEDSIRLEINREHHQFSNNEKDISEQKRYIIELTINTAYS